MKVKVLVAGRKKELNKNVECICGGKMRLAVYYPDCGFGMLREYYYVCQKKRWYDFLIRKKHSWNLKMVEHD